MTLRLCTAGLMAATVLLTSAFSQWTTTPLRHVRQDGAVTDTMLYAFFTPRMESGKKYPLVVFLHGNGGQSVANDPLREALFRAMTDTAVQNHTPCFMMGPVCPQTDRQPKWANTDWGKGSYSLTAVPISISMLLLGDLIRHVCAIHPIDTNRIQLAGGSMGGYGAWDAILRYPKLFASSSPVSGAGDPTRAADIAHVPVWAFAETGDALCPVSGSREMVAAMRAAGSFPVYTEYSTGFYHIWSQPWEPKTEFHEPRHIPWMMRQVKSTAVPSKVAGLTAVADGSYSVKLTWQPATDAVGDPRRIHYFVYRNGVQIGPTDLTLDSTSFTDTDSTLKENTVYSYTVKAINDNSYLGQASDAASVTTPADNTPPLLLEARDGGDSVRIILAFSERLDPASARAVSNYSADKGLTIQQATLLPGSRTVMLTVSPMTLNTTYTISAGNLKDQTGRNAVATGSTVSYTFLFLKGLKYDYYEITTSNWPDNLDQLANRTPTASGVAQSIGLDYKKRNDMFGLRFTGVVDIEQPGPYQFGLGSDDAAKLYIGNTLLIESDNNYNNATVQLSRGKHSITVFYIQGCCGATLNVRWQKPGELSSRAIPGTALFHSPDGVVPALTGKGHTVLTNSLDVRSVGGGAVIQVKTDKSNAPVSLRVYDLRGRLLRVLIDRRLDGASHTVAFDGKDTRGRALSQGYYIVRLRVGEVNTCRTFLLQ